MYSFFISVRIYFLYPGEILKQTSNSNRTSTTDNRPQATPGQSYIYLSQATQEMHHRRSKGSYILTFLIHHRRTTRHEKRPHTHTAVLYYLIFYAAYTPPQDAQSNSKTIIIYPYILINRSYSQATTDRHRSTGTIIYNSISDTTENATSNGRESAHGLYYNSICYTSKLCIIHCRRDI